MTLMDGFIGSVMAAESLKDGVTILHGPGGCRAFPANYSSLRVERDFEMKDTSFYFSFARVPCTFVDPEDYIYGSSKKVGMVSDMLRKEGAKFATVLESPGASLVGDDIADEISKGGMSDRAYVPKVCMMSETLAHGFDATMAGICGKIVKPQARTKGAVNLVGLPYIMPGFDYARDELHMLLESMGLSVIADIGTGCTIDELRESSSAEFNICVVPEFCRCTCEYYEKQGVRSVFSSAGMPVGFDALESWIRNVAETTGADATRALEIVCREKTRIYRKIESAMGTGEYMNYRRFSIKGYSSMALPLARWLSEEFKMVPEAVELTESDEQCVPELDGYLEKFSDGACLRRKVGDRYVHAVFADGAFAAHLKMERKCSAALTVSLPEMEFVEIRPISVIGMGGCRYILGEILNSR